MIERRVNDNKQKKNIICAGVVKTSPIQMDLKVKKNQDISLSANCSRLFDTCITQVLYNAKRTIFPKITFFIKYNNRDVP